MELYLGSVHRSAAPLDRPRRPSTNWLLVTDGRTETQGDVQGSDMRETFDGCSITELEPDAVPNETLTLADRILDYLRLLGVEYVFGVPGGNLAPLYDALARSTRVGGPRPVVARHESGAAYMAHGYAQVTGRIGVCCSTTGPGATNLVTGVATAFTDRVPLLVLTAQARLSKLGRGPFQDSSDTGVDVVALLDQCVRYSALVSHPEQLEYRLTAAIRTALGSPGGPVHLSLPPDVLTAPARPHLAVSSPESMVCEDVVADPGSLAGLAEAIDEARKVVLFLGAGSGIAIDLIESFATRIGADIITDPMGKRWADVAHPCYRGVFGFAGHDRAREALASREADLVLAVGSDLGEMATAVWDPILLNGRLIHIDSDPEHLTRSPMAKKHVYGNVRHTFTYLLERSAGAARESQRRPSAADSSTNISSASPDGQAKIITEAAPIKPQWLMSELARRAPLSAHFFVDTGNAWAWATHHLQLPLIRGRYHISTRFGAMGWAIGAAVGAAIADRGRPVVCITGDGSFLMTGQELTVAVQENLPVLYVVLNDGALGMIRHAQLLTEAERIAYEIPRTDFAGLARALGARGFTIRTPGDLTDTDIGRVLAGGRPALLDVHIDPDETPPMRECVSSLRVANW